MRLFIYDHCPYCTRVRVALGILNLEYELVVLLNDDEETPIGLVKQKIVPIIQYGDKNGRCKTESLDIVKEVIRSNAPFDFKYTEYDSSDVRQWLSVNHELASKLVIPRCTQIGLEEFATQSAIDYFTKKKENYIGSFKEHLENTPQYLRRMHKELDLVESYMKGEEFFNEKFSLDDITLFPILRNLTMVKDLEFPTKLRSYIERISEKTSTPLFFDRAI